MVNKLKNLAKTAGLAVLGLGLIAPAALAQEQEEERLPTRRDAFQDWSLTCFAGDAGAEVCTISQAFVQQDSNRAILRAIVRKVPGGDNYIMILTVPLGVDLRKGASLQVTENQFINDLSYTMCLPDGCRLQFPLAQEALDAMRTATRGRLIFGRPNQEQNIAVPVSFTGFTEAYAALLAAQ